MLRGLHKLCDKSQWDTTLTQLRTNPSIRSSTTTRGGWGEWTPLHIACKRTPPLDVILALLEASPEAAHLLDMSKRHPLHHAAEWGADWEVLATLYDAHPDSVVTPDNDGRVPLHLAILRSQRDEQNESTSCRDPPGQAEVELLLNLNENEQQKRRNIQNVASITDNDGNTPLHCACHTFDELTLDVLATIASAYPDALTTRNNEGQTPLHLAMLKSTTLMSVEALNILTGLGLDRDPTNVLRMEDEDGRLPLHCACKNVVSFEVLHELLSQYRDAASTKASDGTYPLDVLEEMRAFISDDDDMEELNFKSDLLFAHFPNILPYRTELKRLERLTDLTSFEARSEGGLSTVGTLIWTWLCTAVDKEGLYANAVRAVVERVDDADAVRVLAEVPVAESGGIPVKDAASRSCVGILQPYFRFADHYEFFDEESGLAEPLHLTQRSLLVRLKDYGTGHDDDDILGDDSWKIVVMKFSNDRQIFKKEVNVHKQLFGIPGILPLIKNFDSDRVSTREEETGDALFSQGMSSRVDNNSSYYDLSTYRHALVLPRCDKSLADVWCSTEQWDMKDHLRDIGNSLKLIHSRNWMHGDVNVDTLLRHDGRFHLTSLESACQLHTDHLGGLDSRYPLQRLNAYPPEMFAVLSSESALQQYKNYYKTVMDDALSYQTMTDLLDTNEMSNLGHCVDGYLNLNSRGMTQASFVDLWDRMKHNASLWSVIRPRALKPRQSSVDPELPPIRRQQYVVPKTYHVNHRTNLPYQANLLPYQIHSAVTHIDIWNFGLLIYQLHANNPLFNIDRHRNIVADEDILTLGTWTRQSIETFLGTSNPESDGTSRTRPIDDPLVRDLLRKILIPKDDRLSSMEHVLEHPYFDPEGSIEAASLRKQILLQEEDVRVETSRQKALKDSNDAWLANKTVPLKVVGVEDNLIMVRSTSSQWTRLLQWQRHSRGEPAENDDYLYPTGYVLLPYELDRDGHALDQHLCSIFSLRLAETVYETACLSTMIAALPLPEGTDLVLRKTVKDYLDANNGLVEVDLAGGEADATIAKDICDWFISRAENAVKYLTDVLSQYFREDLTTISPEGHAKKIVYHVLFSGEDNVTMEDIIAIRDELSEAETAFAILEKMRPTEDDAAVVASVRADFYAKSFSPRDRAVISRLMRDKATIDNGLMDTIKNYAGNAVETERKVVSDRLMELMELYDEGYVYLMDECNGRPIVYRGEEDEEGMMDAEAYAVVTNVRDYLPGFRLSVKTAAGRGNVIRGVSTLVGLHEDAISDDYREAMQYCTLWHNHNETLGGAAIDGEYLEYATFYEMLHTTGSSDPLRDLDTWRSFLLANDPARYYNGLKHIISPEGKMSLWAMDDAKNQISERKAESLKEHGLTRVLDGGRGVIERLTKEREEKAERLITEQRVETEEEGMMKNEELMMDEQQHQEMDPDHHHHHEENYMPQQRGDYRRSSALATPQQHKQQQPRSSSTYSSYRPQSRQQTTTTQPPIINETPLDTLSNPSFDDSLTADESLTKDETIVQSYNPPTTTEGSSMDFTASSFDSDEVQKTTSSVDQTPVRSNVFTPRLTGVGGESQMPKTPKTPSSSFRSSSSGLRSSSNRFDRSSNSSSQNNNDGDNVPSWRQRLQKRQDPMSTPRNPTPTPRNTSSSFTPMNNRTRSSTPSKQHQHPPQVENDDVSMESLSTISTRDFHHDVTNGGGGGGNHNNQENGNSMNKQPRSTTGPIKSFTKTGVPLRVSMPRSSTPSPGRLGVKTTTPSTTGRLGVSTNSTKASGGVGGIAAPSPRVGMMGAPSPRRGNLVSARSSIYERNKLSGSGSGTPVVTGGRFSRSRS